MEGDVGIIFFWGGDWASPALVGIGTEGIGMLLGQGGEGAAHGQKRVVVGHVETIPQPQVVSVRTTPSEPRVEKMKELTKLGRGILVAEVKDRLRMTAERAPLPERDADLTKAWVPDSGKRFPCLPLLVGAHAVKHEGGIRASCGGRQPAFLAHLRMMTALEGRRRGDGTALGRDQGFQADAAARGVLCLILRGRRPPRRAA